MAAHSVDRLSQRSWLWNRLKAFLFKHYAERFLFSFCLHLPLVAIFTFVTAVATQTIGEGFGLGLLLEHEDPGRQFFGGMFIAFLFGDCLVLGYVFDGREVRHPDTTPHKQPPARSFLGYSASVVISYCVTAILVYGFYSFLQSRIRQVSPGTADSQADFPAIVWAGAIAAFFLIVWAVALPDWSPIRQVLDSNREWIGQTIDHYRRKGWLREGASVTLRLIQQFITPCLLFIIFTIIFVALRQLLWNYAYSPVVISFYFLYLLLSAYGLLYYIHPRLIPLLLLIGTLVIGLGGLPLHKYRLSDLTQRYKTTLKPPYNNLQKPLEAQEAAEDPDIAANPEGKLIAIDEVQFRQKGEPRKPLVVVVASGGGLRAAAWTFAMLERLEGELRSTNASEADIYLPRHLRIISGASGGLLGAAYYVATVPDPNKESFDAKSRTTSFEGKYEKLTRDSLTPILDEMLFFDFPAMFSPWYQDSDRGIELEKVWHHNLNNALNINFANLKAGELAGWRPSIIFSPMMIEDGRRLFISNLDLQRVVRNAGNVLENNSQTYSFEGIEFFRRFRNAPLKLSTAARLSASFPFFSPAVVLPTRPRRRVVDAGYYDNYGVSVAASYLFSTTHLEWIEEHVSGILLIQIRDGLSQNERTMGKSLSDNEEPPPNQLSLALEELTSPIEGVLSARVSTASYRNDGMLEVLSNYFKQYEARNESIDPKSSFFFTTVTFEYPGTASLSWYLTRMERANIRAAAGLSKIDGWPEAHLTGEQEKAKIQIDNDIKAIKTWWTNRRENAEEASHSGDG